MTYEHNPKLRLPIDVLPHRDPILWVDGVVSDDGNEIEAFWCPGGDHFNSTGILEEMKLVETLAQTGAYSIFRASEKPLVPLFAGIDYAKFDEPVLSGETLNLRVSILDKDKRSFKGKGTATIGGRVACETVISGAIMPERAASMYLGGREPVIAETIEPNDDFIDPTTTVFREYEATDRWLDGITDSSRDSSEGFWLPQEEHYAGHHFGGKAVLPGIRQVGALKFLAEYHSIKVGDGVFTGVEDVAFKRPVLLGERLDLQVELAGSSDRYAGIVKVGGEVACEATLLFGYAA